MTAHLNLAKQIFFSTKDNYVYVLLRSWSRKDFDIKSLKGVDVASVQLLGTKKKVGWKTTATGLTVSLPDDYALINKVPVYTLKVKMK